jgi:serine protease AprX
MSERRQEGGNAMNGPSEDHLEAFLRRERVAIERLRLDWGAEALAKLDLVTTREVVAERRRRELDELLGEAPGFVTRSDRVRVVVTRRTGRTATRRRPPARSRRERIIEGRRLRERGTRLAEPVARAVEESDGEVEDILWLTHSVVAEVRPSTLATVAARRDIATINHDKQILALALDVSRPLIQADQVETGLGITGVGVDVAILDTGIDSSHPDLTVVSQQDFTGEGVGDFHGHGTHCAGVATGAGGRFRGVAPGANLHDYKLMDSMGSTSATVAVTAISQAVADGMEVLSNSWGFSHANGNWVDANGTCALCIAADNATTTSVFVVAGGNEDEDTCSTYDTWLRCPGMADLPVTVGASDDSDNMADFSSRGPTPDGRCKPDVVAPGVDIIAARASTGSDMNGSANPIDASYIEASGTSMSTPHVAGIAALMLERNARLTNQNVKDGLMATAVDIGADPCTEQGAGRVDALAAVNAV